ncbi:hypothetical protein NQ176_g6708 [Zarea fungicola]|uniref:Uncharacterized protein n=1 Tax=Zarea fungicola TaxID=93591 RepID=A0ACC1N2Y0_9HYPO|nr:hypothetical protein NQ176_g6708 [Lecanicillium fungicola]
MFPNMTSFTYGADAPPMWSSEAEATPSEIIDAMLPLKDKLATLTLDFHFSPAAENCDWDRDEMSLSKLSQMTALRHLSITASDVVWDDHSDGSETESEEEFADEAQGSHVQVMKDKQVKESPHAVFLQSIMPPNLETLHLSSIPRGFSMMPFADIAAISYPNLKTIYMGDFLDDLADDLDVVKANPPIGCDVTVAGDDLFHWKASITGPENSAYAGGLFHLDIRFPTEYPFRQPKINFATKIYHLNISENGIICLEFLMDKWQPTMQVANVLYNIRQQLSSVEEDNAVNIEAASVFKVDKEKYYQTAREWTNLFAAGT